LLDFSSILIDCAFLESSVAVAGASPATNNMIIRIRGERPLGK
jgi:hypothetical protein